MLKERRGQIEDGEQRRVCYILRRVKEKVVLPDPRSHPWKLELHYACLLGAEIMQKPLLLAMPSKTERERDKMKECSFSTPPALHSPITIPQWLNYLEARKQENLGNAVFCKPEKGQEGRKMDSGLKHKRLAQCGHSLVLINEL